MNYNEIIEVLQEPTGRFKYGVLNEISKRHGIPYHKVSNVLRARKIAPVSVDERVKVWDAARSVAESLLSNGKESVEKVFGVGSPTHHDVNLIFKSFLINGQTHNVVSIKTRKGEIIVGYEGVYGNLTVKIDIDDMLDFIKGTNMNYVRKSVDESVVVDPLDFFKDYDEICVHEYLSKTIKFEIL